MDIQLPIQKRPFWRRRYVWARTILLLAVLALCVGAYYYRHSKINSADNGRQTTGASAPTSSGQQSVTPQLQKPIDTPHGKRYAKLDAVADLQKATDLVTATKALQTFMDQYGVTVQTSTVTPSDYVKKNDTYTSLADADTDLLKKYGALFMDEWAKYPRDFVDRSSLKYVVLTKDLAIQGQQRAATPDPDGHAMYYDIGYAGDTYNREVIHHEFDHFVEYAVFGNYARADDKWTAQNPGDFAYRAGGGASAYKETSFVNTPHPSAGFVDHYASYAIEEDKAETFAYLMTTTYYHSLKDWIKTDDKLASKVVQYKDFLTSISPEMSGDYFDSINP